MGKQRGRGAEGQLPTTNYQLPLITEVLKLCLSRSEPPPFLVRE
ncbi:hypothetical protein [Chroococcidiopsis sp.]